MILKFSLFAETEDNYTKILELLNEEDQGDKNKLVELIEDFHNRYQSIYERYDNITGKLKEKVRSKKEKDSSSSSSSDSDLDDSSKKHGSKNGKFENKISLKEEIQAANTAIDELKRKLIVETEEKEALNSRVQETEKMLNESKLQVDGLHEENSKLLADNRDLSSKLENSIVLETELNQKIEDMNKEKFSLMSENETVLTTIEEFRAIIAQLKGEKDGFESELEDVKGEFSKTKEKLITTEDEVSNLIQKVEITELENKSLLVKVSKLSEEIKIEREKVEEFSLECSQLREKLAEKENEFLKQTEMHESFKNESEIKMTGFVEEIECLQIQKTEIEKQKEEEILGLNKKSEDKETGLLSQIDNLTETINNLQKELENTNRDQERLLEEKEIHESKIKDLESKLEFLTEEIQNGIKSKDQIVDQLEETIEDLKSDLEIKGEEVNTLTETIRNLEVKIRLANQKLRVTEQVLNGTEQDHATKEEKLHQEITSLMEKISTLTQTITTIKRDVQEKVNETLTGIDSLTVKFEEDYGHMSTRVYEITNEVQAAHIQIKKIWLEKDVLKQKFEETVTKLELSEGENDRLRTGIVKKDEEIKELENKIHMKDEWIFGIGEDKREAIKQLSIWADYQRDRCDYLHELLLKTTTRARVR